MSHELPIPAALRRHLQHAGVVYREVFENDVYELGLNKGKAAPEVVFDLGANRGCFTTACKATWPNAEVWAVEPHPASLTLLQTTAQHFQGVQILHAAIGDGPLYFTPANSDAGHQYSSRPASSRSLPCEVPAISLPSLVSRANNRPYALKLDIEGTEFELLSEANEAVFRNAVLWWMEIHIPTIDEFVAGLPACDNQFLQAHLERSTAALAWLNRQTTTHELKVFMPNPVIWMATGLKTIRPWSS